MTISDAPGIAIPETPEERLFADIVRNLDWKRYDGISSCDCLIGQEAEALGIPDTKDVVDEIASRFHVDAVDLNCIYGLAMEPPYCYAPDAALVMAADSLGVSDDRAAALRTAAEEGQ